MDHVDSEDSHKDPMNVDDLPADERVCLQMQEQMLKVLRIR